MLAQVIDLFHDGWSEIKKCFCSAKLVQKVIGLVVYWFLTTSDLDFSDDIIFEENVQEDCAEGWFKEFVFDSDNFDVLSIFDHLVGFHDIGSLFANNCSSNHISDGTQIAIVFSNFLLNSYQVFFHITSIAELCVLELLPHYGLEKPIILLSVEIEKACFWAKITIDQVSKSLSFHRWAIVEAAELRENRHLFFEYKYSSTTSFFKFL